MKIIQVCPRYYPEIGGIETHVKEISEILVKKGFDVEVVCTDSSGRLPKQEIINGVEITRLWAFAPGDAYHFSPAIYFYIKNQDYDILHVHNYHAFPALFACAASNKKIIFTPHYHGGSSSYLRNLLLKPYNWIGRYIFETAEKIICVSKYEMMLIENDFNISKDKLVHIPNGVNLVEFNNIKELKKDSKIILYAGRLESYKGIQYIIEALPILDGYRLEIIGKGNYEKKLHEIAKKLNVYDRIDWLENLTRDVFLSHFKSADVFVNLSTFEAYGITVAEALVCGTPCIVSTGGALFEFVDGEGCVGLGYPIDIIDLAKLIKSRKRISPRRIPDWEEITTDLIRLYSA